MGFSNPSRNIVIRRILVKLNLFKSFQTISFAKYTRLPVLTVIANSTVVIKKRLILIVLGNNIQHQWDDIRVMKHLKNRPKIELVLVTRPDSNTTDLGDP